MRKPSNVMYVKCCHISNTQEGQCFNSFQRWYQIMQNKYRFEPDCELCKDAEAWLDYLTDSMES